jgi:uncharacterized protein (TIGR02996 family)
MREMFEQAILDDPDEPSHYAAFADWLMERGDPRGELIQVQLALEDEGRRGRERAALRRREKSLLRRHERQWLGELAPFLIDYAATPDERRRAVPRVQYRWERGLLTALSVRYLTTAFAHALADASAARFLRELRVYSEARYWDEDADRPRFRVPKPAGVGEHWELLELIGAPCLTNLRVFQMGDADGEPPEEGYGSCHTYALGLEHVVAGMPRVEELHLLCKAYSLDRLFALPNLTHLRVLRVYHFGVRNGNRGGPRYEYPLDVLAANPALTNLTHLLFHPHIPEYHFDAYREQQRTGRYRSFLPLARVRAVLRSPHLRNLTHLQLRLSDMGDDGIRELINSGALSRLRWLDLRHGCVSDEGARLLADCPDARRLEHLDLSRNAVGRRGLAALRKAGVPVRAVKPLTASQLERDQYLFEGDGE